MTTATTPRQRAIELEIRADAARTRRHFLAQAAGALGIICVLATSTFSAITLLEIRNAQVSHEQTLSAIARVQADLDHKFVLVITSACHAQPNSKACAKLLAQIKEKS